MLVRAIGILWFAPWLQPRINEKVRNDWTAPGGEVCIEMAKLLLCFLLVSALVLPALSQDKKQSNALESLVETERAFSRTSTEQGTRAAFVAFIAEDGILFRPTAVVGRKWK